MVSLGVAEAVHPGCLGLTNLRHRGLWYPDIPSPRLSLNESSVSGVDLHKYRFHPLFWTMFGGAGGMRLSHLTSISVLFNSCIRVIRFGYHGNEAEQGVHTTELGRYRPGELEETGETRTESFRINGAGGERISAISLRIKCPNRRNETTFSETWMTGLKVLTNHYRSHVFSDYTWEDELGVDEKQSEIRPEPGTIITGLYAHQVRKQLVPLPYTGMSNAILRRVYRAVVSLVSASYRKRLTHQCHCDS